MAQAAPKILIIGGGFGGLFSALELAGTGEVTLVSEEDHFLFKPMLYEYLSGEVSEPRGANFVRCAGACAGRRDQLCRRRRCRTIRVSFPDARRRESFASP